MPRNDDSFRPWMPVVLYAAAIYNLVWGSWVILRPGDLFTWTGLPQPLYPGIWQCVGMIVGVYGIGYGLAARDPLRHWPIVLVGFLGKILGPIGMLQNILLVAPGTPGHFPATWLWINLTNDVIWWLPFGAILYAAFRQFNAPERSTEGPIELVHTRLMTQHGATLSRLSAEGDVLVVFLRHSGCTFCRETLAEIASQRAEIEASATILLVHMGVEEASTQAYFDHYGLGDVHRISDPQCELYQAYKLRRGRFSELFGLTVWWRGFIAAVLKRHAVGRLGGDGFQLAGAFLVRDDEIRRSFRHRHAADTTDYCELAGGR